MPKRSAATAWRRFTVGSRPKTSSPSSAFAIASRMARDGRVTVSLRRSIGAIALPDFVRETRVLRSELAQAVVQLFQRSASRAELAFAELVERKRHGVE